MRVAIIRQNTAFEKAGIVLTDAWEVISEHEEYLVIRYAARLKGYVRISIMKHSFRNARSIL